MLLEKYEQEGLLFNKNFVEKSSTDGLVAFRGELVLVQGEVADDKGHKKPPSDVIRHNVLLEDNGKIAFATGCLNELAQLTTFIEKYKDDFAAEMQALFYVANISKSLQVDIDGFKFVLIPLLDGIAWNELIDELAMEKSDFKGQSSSDKIVTLWKEYKSGYKPKYESVSFDQAFEYVIEVKKMARGPV